MRSQYEDIFAELAAPFAEFEVKERAGSGGQRLKYVTARTVMNRLDNVLGPENWWDDYVAREDSVLCKLTIRLPDGSVLTKVDAGGYAGMSDSGDDDKSGYSDGFKRAAVKFGVSRYLYRDGVPSFAAPLHNGQPSPQRAQDQQAPQQDRQPPPQQQGRGGFDNFRLPPADKWKAIFAWAKAMEEVFETTVVQRMGETAKSLGYPQRFDAWSTEQAERICKLTAKWLTTLDNYAGQFDGKIDLSGVSLEGAESEAKLMKAIRAEIIDTIKKTHIAYSGSEPSRDEIRSALDRVSSMAADSTGHKGTVVEKLNECADATWLHNMLAVADAELKEVSSRSSDDIPF